MGVKETHKYIGFYVPKDVHAYLPKLALQNGYKTVNAYVKALVELEVAQDKFEQEKTAQRTVH